MAADDDVKVENEEASDDMPDGLQLYTSMQFDSLVLAKCVLERMEKLGERMKSIVVECQRSLCIEKAATVHQGTLLPYFGL